MRKLKIAVIALLTAGVLGTGVALVGCASAPDPEQAVRASLESELGVFQNPSQEQIDELVADLAGTDEFTTYGIDVDEYIKTMLDGFAYSVDSVEVGEDGKTAVGNVTITCKSTVSATAKAEALAEEWVVANAASLATMTEDELNLEIGKLLMRAVAESEPVTSSCSLDYELIDGTWTPADTAESQLMKAFYA